MKDDEAIIYAYGSLVLDSGRYAPPEVSNGGWDSIKSNPVSAVDSYNYGVLITEVFNGGLSSWDQVGQTKGIPPSMHTSYKRLLNANPKARLSITHFLEQGVRKGGFFETPLIQLSEGIDNLGLKTETEREDFLQQLDAVSDDFPEEFFKMKVLPELLKSVEFGGGGAKVFALVMRICKELSDDEYDTQITPVIVRLFTSPDRALRVSLLDNLPFMVDHLSQKIITDKIWPQLVTGFTDLAPLVREQTVKAVLVIINKLSDRVINGELLRYLAKTANDEQPGIRTNTTICLGKIARNLGPSSRTKVLTAAFSRSLRDPFLHARNAALMALAATADVFTEDDCALRILPSICPSLIDKEKIVRDQASKTMDVYLQRIRRHAQMMPDSVLPPTTALDGATNTAPRMSTPHNDSSWAGWAISSFTNKLATASGEIQSNNNGTSARPAELTRSASTPSASSLLSISAAQSRPSTAMQTSTPMLPRAPSSLRNAHSPSPSVSEIEDDFNGAWAEMDDEETPDAWGDEFSSSTFAQPSLKPTGRSQTSLSDQDEPDFEGWLKAQAQAKSKSKAPLPKGLTKTKTKVAPARPTTVSRSQSQERVGSVSAAKTAKPVVVPAAKPAVVQPVKKQSAPAPAAEEEEEDWGDAWG
ncbi:Nuclear aminoacylation-dependent tRNA export pathway component [Elasticomyces elasticus]|nr:Nuclear aminoacylation-dependent tRNA export pathway component [Elasticomyces elasticus]